MDKEALIIRTKAFSLRLLKLVHALPNSIPGRAVSNQLVRSGTSVGANYRAACRARSKAEFISKLGIVLEETDESAYWLEIIEESGMLSEKQVSLLRKEADELAAILYSAIQSTKASNAKC